MRLPKFLQCSILKRNVPCVEQFSSFTDQTLLRNRERKCVTTDRIQTHSLSSFGPWGVQAITVLQPLPYLLDYKADIIIYFITLLYCGSSEVCSGVQQNMFAAFTAKHQKHQKRHLEKKLVEIAKSLFFWKRSRKSQWWSLFLQWKKQKRTFLAEVVFCWRWKVICGC